MSLALPIQVLLAQIGVPAFQHDGEEAPLIFFGQAGHTNVKGMNTARCALLEENIHASLAAQFRDHSYQVGRDSVEPMKAASNSTAPQSVAPPFKNKKCDTS